VFSRSDPTALTFTVQTDTGTSSDVSDIVKNLWQAAPALYYIVCYGKPGSNTLIQYLCQMQGFSMSISPEVTEFTFNLAPASFTGVFTLNSNVFGILDQNILSFSW